MRLVEETQDRPPQFAAGSQIGEDDNCVLVDMNFLINEDESNEGNDPTHACLCGFPEDASTHA